MFWLYRKVYFTSIYLPNLHLVLLLVGDYDQLAQSHGLLATKWEWGLVEISSFYGVLK